MRKRGRGTWIQLAAVAATAACSDEPAQQTTAAERGRHVYQNVCIACHSADPSREGSLGPPVAGATRELLEAKLLRGEYPPGYTPRREGGAMPKFKYLADSIDDLAAYLAQPGG